MPNPVPAGYATVTPYLCVADAAKLIEFLKQAFDAQLLFKMDGPGGRIMHAEMTIGDSRIMLAQPEPGKETHAMIHLYIPDTDAVYARAIAAGATSVREPADQFYGDRSAGVRDEFGNQWYIATHIEDVSQEEMERRMAAMKATA
jgi:PhnB protein